MTKDLGAIAVQTLFVVCLVSAVLAVPVHAAERLRVVTLGDSHSAIEGGFARALASATGKRVEHIHVGVVGASIWDLLRDMPVQRRFKLETLSAWHPGLILVAFGTNEAKSWTTAKARAYSTAWEQVLNTLKRIFPGARIIVVGPPDADLRGLAPVRAIQETMAAQCGAGWVDRVDLMGGEGSMSLWRAARGGRYASRDGVHLTADGYSELADRVAPIVAEKMICSFARGNH